VLTAGVLAVGVLVVAPLVRWAVAVHAVPAGQPWRRGSPNCHEAHPGKPRPRGFVLGGRCRPCGGRVGPPPLTVEAAVAASAVALLYSGLSGLRLAAYAWWAAFGIALCFVDIAVQRLPGRLCYAAAAGLLALLGIDAALTGSWGPWTRAALGGVVAAALLAACALALPGFVHWGDVRYALPVGAASAWFGWSGLYVAAFAWTLVTVSVGAVLMAARRATLATQLPQGPAMLAGAMIAIVLLRPPL
jgi:leader peptidase (prepilin peptidase) / N-methyltransferase